MMWLGLFIFGIILGIFEGNWLFAIAVPIVAFLDVAYVRPQKERDRWERQNRRR